MKRIKRILILLLSLSLLSACKPAAPTEVTRLSFKAAAGYDYLKTLDGSTVTINGYLATSSPADGSFIFLMNLPYQSCPFCKPNTSQLSNTMEVYPKKGQKFGYTNQAVKVTGTLVVAASPDKSFTDPYGYEFNFKIVDAEYKILSAEELGAEAALWQRVADADIVNDLYRMYDFLSFVCTWPEYFVNSFEDADGKWVTGYFLYPTDALYYLDTDGAQYNYGCQEGYFDDLIRRVEAIDKTAFADLCENIRGASVLAERALAELRAGNYSSEYQYIEKFNSEDYIYTLNDGEALAAEYDRLYFDFADWLGSWEM